MKKIILMLLTLSLILSLFSCTTLPETSPSSEEIEETAESNTADNYEHDFILTYLNLTDIYKIYPEEGVLIPACVDPLCKHGDYSCPLTNATSIIMVGDLIYYTRYTSGRAFYNKICTYDLYTGEYNEIYETEKKTECISSLHVSDKYIFFNVYNANAPSEDRLYRIMRYDLSTKETITLDSGLPDTTTLLKIADGRAYWLHVKYYYSTDLDYKNRIEDDKIVLYGRSFGGYSIETKITGNIVGTSGARYPEKTISRINVKTGEKSVLIESTGSTPVAYKGKVIYTRVEKALFLGRGLHYINGKETLIYDKFGGKLYVCNIDGSEDKLLCDIAGNNCILDSGAYTIGGVYGAGDYALWKLWYYEPAKENPKVLQRGKDRILAVNINTGEYKILSAE